MESTGILPTLIFIIISLVAGAILKLALKKTFIPYTVGLFAFGLAAGILCRNHWLSFSQLTDSAVASVGEMDPNIILYVFLPVLIFEAAYNLDIHIFRKTLINATLLSVPGVGIAMFLTAALLIGLNHVIPSYNIWSWNAALMFGALISATDPVAVVALLKELNTSKRFSTLVDAESMLNDGTGIVLFMLFFGSFTAAGMSTTPVRDFIVTVGGGILIGFAIAAVCMLFLVKVKGNPTMQNSMIILSAYTIFFLAESTFEVSGVIALVAFGLTVAYYGPLTLSPRVTSFIEEFWELAAYIANTLIFIIVGVLVAMKSDITWNSVIVLAALYMGITLIRLFVIFFFYPIMSKVGYGLNKRESIILGWGGLRGALGLTLALLVSYTPGIPAEIRGEVLFLTAGIVTLTLCLNATTMGWMLKKMGMTEKPSALTALNYSVRSQICDHTKEYMMELQNEKALEGTDWNAISALLPSIDSQKPDAEVHTAAVMANIRLKILEKEKALALQIYNQGIISQNSLKKLTNVIEDLYDLQGNVSLTQQQSVIEKIVPSHLRKYLLIDSLQNLYRRYFNNKLVARYDLLRGFILLQESAYHLVDEFDDSTTLSAEDIKGMTLLKNELKSNIRDAQQQLERLSRRYPQAHQKAMTQKAARMLLGKEKKLIHQYYNDGLITVDEMKEYTEKADIRINEVL